MTELKVYLLLKSRIIITEHMQAKLKLMSVQACLFSIERPCAVSQARSDVRDAPITI